MLTTIIICMSTDIEEKYDLLIKLLHMSIPSAIEIDILPSTSCQVIQYDPSAIALPKSVLAQCYVHARQLFLRPDPGLPNPNRELQLLRATTVILLWDPNHITAVNWRKKHLIAMKESSGEVIAQDGELNKRMTDAIFFEMILLESLLTSPLPKHTKANTLWTHRLWIVEAFTGMVLPSGTDTEIRRFWYTDLSIVMKSGDRHPRNYYAWNYCRQLYKLLSDMDDTKVSEDVMLHSITVVQKWCLSHPRDISGWSFLLFLIKERTDRSCLQNDGKSIGLDDEVQRILWQTEEFVRKYGWRGESIEYFLKWATQLQRDHERIE